MADCLYHPGIPAAESCQRCGSFVCSACLGFHGAARYCPPCLKRFSLGQVTPMALWSLIMGAAGFSCLFFPGIAGLILAQVELGRIDRGESPESSRTYARAGWWLGLVNVILVGVMGVVALGIFLAVLAEER